MSAPISHKALFEPSPLFDFLPTPPGSTKAPSDSEPKKKQDEDDVEWDMEAELAMMEAAEAERRLGTPPPPMEEEPDWEMDSPPPPSRPPPPVRKLDSRDVGGFVSSGLLDFESAHPPAHASGSRPRIDLTPPPELTRSQLDDILATTTSFRAESAPCFLPDLSATTCSGRSVQFKRRNRPKMPLGAEVEHDRSSAAGAASLLSIPLHKLLGEVEEMRDREKAVRLQATYDAEQNRASTSSSSKSKSMWVDKYRPKKYADLLGEDRIHRDVMAWLKEWDKCVFKRVPQAGKKRKTEEAEANPYTDPLGRPRERILLLSGPPGLGKTTLAHLLARQAGYKPLEINASDDRNAATVTTRMRNALDAGTGIGGEGRPVCVVVDEVDGASGGGEGSFIRSLIKLIQDVPARKKSNTPARPLRRPIICICNDLYATSLRPLRPFCRIVRFRKPQAQLLVRRLRDICDREGLEADLRVLTGLVEMTGGDVRSCLNTLQFIKSKSPVVTDSLLRSTTIGLKDTSPTLQTLWKSLLVPPTSKSKRSSLAASADFLASDKYINRLQASLSAVGGDLDKAAQGMFEHYPLAKPIDASLGNLCKVLGWFGWYDQLNRRVGEGGDWEMAGYMSYSLVGLYSGLSGSANAVKQVEWPKADYEAFVARQANEEIAKAFFSGTIPPILRTLFGPSTMYTELIPLLMRIVTPPLRPVNAHIVKPAERAVLDRLVELLLPMGLRFEVEKTEGGQPMMRLEPAIDVFVHYEGKRAEDIAASRFAVRQLIAQAMDAETARRRGKADSGQSGAGTTAEGFKGMYNNKGGKAVNVEGKAEVIATDFFGRVVVKPHVDVFSAPTDDNNLPSVLEPVRKKFRAVYKFHEGSSSAVRKSIKMSALM